MGLCLYPEEVQADDFYWTNTSPTGDFTNVVNWVTNGLAVTVVPGPADNVFFTNNAATDVPMRRSFTNANVYVTGGIITQTLGGTTWWVTNSFVIGQVAGVTGNVVNSSATGTLIVTNGAGTGAFVVGAGGPGVFTWSQISSMIVDTLVATNGVFSFSRGRLTTLHGSTITNSSTFTIGGFSGSGSFWTMEGGTNLISLGGASTFVKISNAGSVTTTVRGASTLWTNNVPLRVGDGGKNSALIITNGGVVDNTAGYVGSSSAPSNGVLVADSGSKWRNSSELRVGDTGWNNQLTVSNGGFLLNTLAYIGNNSAASNNAVTVSDPGSIWTNTSTLFVGNTGSVNQILVTNGGRVFSAAGRVGAASASLGNLAILSGTASLWRMTGALHVGSNATTLGQGSIFLNNGAVLEANIITNGFSGTGNITNSGGIFEFSSVAPQIGTNTLDSIVVTNGTISYRDVTAADIFNTDVSNLTFQGNNTFRLNNSTNVTVSSYTFGTNNGNLYQHLTLFSGNTRWQGAVWTMGSGGILSISNTRATISGLFTNSGTVHVFNSRVTFENPVILSGGYISDPSTNVFATNVTLTSSGYFQAATGDLYQFERNLTIQSTQSNLFNLASATVVFTNFGGEHLLDLTGSSALDRGTNGLVQLADVTNHFVFGTLQIAGAGDTLRVTGAVNNALYVGTLDLGALANTNKLMTDVNVYYDANLPGNAYLGRTTYDLLGAGMLIPYGVPEPGILLWGVLAVGGIGWRLRHRTWVEIHSHGRFAVSGRLRQSEPSPKRRG